MAARTGRKADILGAATGRGRRGLDPTVWFTTLLVSHPRQQFGIARQQRHWGITRRDTLRLGIGTVSRRFSERYPFEGLIIMPD
jgi:hypothetical protein